MPISPVGAHGDELHGNHDIETIASRDSTPAFPELCAQIHERVETFLNTEPANERIKGVQWQSRKTLDVLENALQRYRWVVKDTVHEDDS